MSARLEISGGTKFLLTSASLVVIFAGLRALAPVFLPLLLALFLTIVSLPALQWMLRRGVRPVLAVAVTVLVVFGLLSALGLVISGTIDDFTRAVPAYTEQLMEKFKGLLGALEARDIRVTEWVSLESMDPAPLVDLASGILRETVRGVAAALSQLTLVLLLMVFMLAEAVGFEDKLKAALGVRSRAIRDIARITREIEHYLKIKTAISILTGILLGLWVWTLGVPFPLLWAMLAFVLNYIPSIGSILAAVPPVLVTLVQYGPGRALAVALGYLAVNVVVGNLLEPRWMGRRFGLSTLVVFLSLIFWGWMWGPLGMLLSVPLTMATMIVLENSKSMRWLAALLGRAPDPLRAQELGRTLNATAAPPESRDGAPR